MLLAVCTLSDQFDPEVISVEAIVGDLLLPDLDKVSQNSHAVEQIADAVKQGLGIVKNSSNNKHMIYALEQIEVQLPKQASVEKSTPKGQLSEMTNIYQPGKSNGPEMQNPL